MLEGLKKQYYMIVYKSRDYSTKTINMQKGSIVSVHSDCFLRVFYSFNRHCRNLKGATCSVTCILPG